MIEIRKESPDDIPAIRKVNQLAFAQPQEADLIDALRTADAITLSLVAIENSILVGHILFTPISVESDDESFTAVGLGPLAVLPSLQRRGIGSALVKASLDRLREKGQRVVVVLGHPEYYPRFGFKRASDFGIRWEHEAPDNAFMLLELSTGALQKKGGIVRFRPEFDLV